MIATVAADQKRSCAAVGERGITTTKLMKSRRREDEKTCRRGVG
jgi:hypothetical protein